MTCLVKVGGAMQVLLFLLIQAFAVSGVSIPRPFSFYESGEAAKDQPANVRHFRHREEHAEEDGSEYALHWEVETDPESLLELDLEHRNGVKILDCQSDHLAVQVPTELLERLQRLRHVTGSDFLHGCRHLEGRNLYHRIESIHKVTPLPSNSGAIVEFHTQELEAVQHVFPRCKVHLHVMPAAAQDPDALKKKLEERQLLSPRSSVSEEERRLGFTDWMSKGIKKLGTVSGTKVNMNSGFEPEADNSNQENSFFNLNDANQNDKFHWNYTYKANSSENPQFKYTFPGGTTWLRLFKPYMDANVGFTMNLSSHMPGLMQPPHVTTDSVVQSVADMDLDVGLAANFDKDESASVLNNVLDQFPIPILSKVKADSEIFMKPMVFHIGGTPVTVTPGWSVNMKIFHIGRLKGTMRVGLKTLLITKGSSHFDTDTGEKHNITAKMLNVSFTPPTWLLFTQSFQLGVELEPSVWIKGGFGSMDGMEMGMSLRPFFNVSVQQEQQEGNAVTDLAVYPYRASGLPAGKSYAIKISANGKYIETATQMSTGVVEYQNKVSNFDFGPMAEETLLKTPIQVSIIENGGQEVATADAVCQSINDGMCQPGPLVAKMDVDGQAVEVQMMAVFEANALQTLESKMKAISLRFPMLTISTQAANILQVLSNQSNMQNAEIRVKANGHTFRGSLRSKFSTAVQVLTSDDIWELGPSFVETWKQQSTVPTVFNPTGINMGGTAATAFGGTAAFGGTSTTAAPTTTTAAPTTTTINPMQNIVQFVVGGTVIAQGNLPGLMMNEEQPVNTVEDLETQSGQQVTPSQMQVMLQGTGLGGSTAGQMVGTAQVELDIMPADMGAFWIQPFQASQFTVGTPYTFAWATHGAVSSEEYEFNLTIYEVQSEGVLAPTSFNKQVEVTCTNDPEVVIHRYTGAETPCVFEHVMTADASLADKQVLAMATWSDAMDLPHYMASPPFFFTSSRRLQSEAASSVTAAPATTTTVSAFGFESMGHQEGYSSQAQQAFQELQTHCNAEPLKYSAGAGLDMVTLFKNPMGGSMDMGAMGAMSAGSGGALDANGNFVTKPQPLWRLGQNPEAVAKLFPKSVCAGGICNGMMPGCQSTETNPIDIPRIVYKFSRTFDWKDHVGVGARHIIAYGLMLLPTAVQQAKVELEAEAAAAKLQNSTDNNVNQQPFADALNINNFFSGSGSRRLDSFPTSQGGTFEMLTPKGLNKEDEDWSSQGPVDHVTVEITEPMDYKITHPVMRYLLATDAFRGLEDGREAELGPVRIVGYELLDSPREAKAKAKARNRQAQPSEWERQRAPAPKKVRTGSLSNLWEFSNAWKAGSNSVSGAVIGCLAFAALIALVASVAFIRRHGYQAVSPLEASSVTPA